MFLSRKLCCLCVKNDKITINAESIDIDNIKIMDKLIFCIPELTYNISDHLVYVCTICHDNLNLLYKFKNTCMNNYKHFLDFITEMRNSSNNENVFKEATIIEPECSILQTNDYPESDTEMITQNICVSEIRSTEEEKNYYNFTEVEKDDYNFTEDEKIIMDVQTDQDTEESNFLTNQQPNFDLVKIEIPDEIMQEVDEVEETNSELMPKKSRSRYYKELRDFKEWRKKKNIGTVLTESVVLAYVSHLSIKYKASSLWTKFSMLKKAFIVNGDVDISSFGKVIAFIKKQSIDFVPKKYKVLSVADCRKFIMEASDDLILCKIVLIFGLYGACRRDELLKLTIDDIDDYEKYVIVKLQDNRSFIIPNENESLNPYEIYQKYAKLRPRDAGTRRFFLGYRQGKCVGQPAGMHTIGGVPRKVAEFLGLEHPDYYTGHCLRRSGVSMVAEAKISDWKSTKMTEALMVKRKVVSNVPAATSSDEESSRKVCTDSMMPQKSRNRYYKELRDFKEWRKKKNFGKVLNETVILAYISSLSKKYKASSLWTKVSMLKNAFIVNGDVDIYRFAKVKTFMKKQNINLDPKKYKVLSVADCRRFIVESPDEFLLCKVVLIFGLYGACRRDELLKLTVDDIEDHEKYVLVKLQDKQTSSKSRSFIIPDASASLNPYEIYRKYAKLRPRDVGTRRFFLGYRQGKCIAQPAGMHTIGGVPRKVASFLGLDHPEYYTGHCLRRSGVNMVVKSGGNIQPVKQIANCKSSKVAENHKDETINIKTESNDVNAGSSSSEEESSGNLSTLPEKSRDRYDKELKHFKEWKSEKNADMDLTEDVVFAYIYNLSKKYKASSLWTKFSMLKKAFIVNGDGDISRFEKVMAFMKEQTVECVPKESKVLSVADCRKFIIESSDDFLLSKVVLLFGLYGACRRDELVKLTIDDIEDHEKYVIVKLQDTRSFIIPDASESLNPYEIYQKYAKLRPRDITTRRFFLGYRQGKCIAQPAGLHTIGGVPRKVAEFVGLDHPENYTWHCLKHSGVSMVAKSGGNILSAMQIGS